MRRSSPLLGLLLSAVTAAAASPDIVLHAGTLLDGQSDAPRSHVSVLIHGGRISAVESGFVDARPARRSSTCPSPPS